MATKPRTFVLRSPHMRGEDIGGEDIREFQRRLNLRYKAWKINKRIDEDNDYGKDTRDAAREVCIGLGIDPDKAMKNGVTPALRTKIKHPDKRTNAEKTRSKGAAATELRAKLRKEFKDFGEVIVLAGANANGKPVTKITMDYLGRMARRLGKPIVVSTGTNHHKFASPGVISDHFTGHAADLGMIANHGTNDGPVGDKLATVGLIEAGVAAGEAAKMAKAGGLFTLTHGTERVQVIWKAPKHHDHVHVGVRPA
jgi:hypothetical protein